MSKRFLGFVLAAACAATTLAAQSGSLRVGAARVEITPPANEFPYPLIFTGGMMPQYVGAHDPLYARALVLDDGKTQAAIVLVDVAEIPKSAEFQRAVAQAIGIPEANLILAANHTHSEPTMYYRETPMPAPPPPPPAGAAGGPGGPGGARVTLTPEQTAQQNDQWTRELKRVIDGATEAARQAKSKLQPARVAFARGKSYVNVHDGEAGAGDPTGPSDKSLDVLRFDGADGKTIALLADYGVPGSTMLHNVTLDKGAEVSGDLLGVAAQLIEKQPESSLVALVAPGSDGDQRPLLRSTPIAVGKLPSIKEGAAAWDMVDVLASILAKDALDLANGMKPAAGDVKISAATKTVSCPTLKRTRDRATGNVTVEDGPPVEIPLHVIRVGDIAIAGVGGSVGTVIGQKFKAASPLTATTLIGMNSASAGYILDDATIANPGPIKSGSLKGGCAENAIVQGLVEMIKAKP